MVINLVSAVNNIWMEMSLWHFVMVELLLWLTGIDGWHRWLNRSAFDLLMGLTWEPIENAGCLSCGSGRSSLVIWMHLAHLIKLIIIALMILSVNFRYLNRRCSGVLLLNLGIHRVACPRLRLSSLFLRHVARYVVSSLLGVDQLIILLSSILWNDRSVQIYCVKSFNWIV